MTPEIVKTNEKIKVGMFLSILSILILLLSSYLVYFYNTEPQRVLRGDTVSYTYVAIALFVSVAAAVVAYKAILNTYRRIMSLSK
jgi:hypothetical protein